MSCETVADSITHDGRAILVPNNVTTTGLGIAGAEVITLDRPSVEDYSPSVAGVLQANVHELIWRVEAALKLMTVNPTNASRDIARR